MSTVEKHVTVYQQRATLQHTWRMDGDVNTVLLWQPRMGYGFPAVTILLLIGGRGATLPTADQSISLSSPRPARATGLSSAKVCLLSA